VRAACRAEGKPAGGGAAGAERAGRGRRGPRLRRDEVLPGAEGKPSFAARQAACKSGGAAAGTKVCTPLALFSLNLFLQLHPKLKPTKEATCTFSLPFLAENVWRAFDSAKNHQRRKRQSVTAKREKSQTPKFV